MAVCSNFRFQFIIRRFIGPLLVSLTLTACNGTIEPPIPTVSKPVTPRDGLALVFLREFSFEVGVTDIADENRIVDCVSAAIHRTRPQQHVIPFREFQPVAFPNLTYESAPRKPEYMRLLLKRPEFRARIEPLNLRYLAFIGGVTKTSGDHVGGACYIGVPSACVIFAEWDHHSRLGAAMVDLRKSTATTKMRSTAAGSGWFALIGVLPLGVPSNTESTACNDLGHQISEYLSAADRRDLHARGTRRQQER